MACIGRGGAAWLVAAGMAAAVFGGGGRAWALRPFVAATDADIVKPGTIEVEVGLGLRWHTQGPATHGTLNVPALVVNLGLLERFELDIGTGFDLLLPDSTKAAGGQTRLASAAATALTGKIRLVEGKEGAPSLTTELTVLFPTQHRQLLPHGSRELAFTGVFVLTGEVGPLRLHGNLGGGVAKSPKDARKVSGSLLWAAAGELPLDMGVAVVAEVRGVAAQAYLPDTTALLGLTWASPWGIKFDVGAFAGVTRGSDNWGVTAGVTFAFEVLPRRRLGDARP